MTQVTIRFHHLLATALCCCTNIAHPCLTIGVTPGLKATPLGPPLGISSKDGLLVIMSVILENSTDGTVCIIQHPGHSWLDVYKPDKGQSLPFALLPELLNAWSSDVIYLAPRSATRIDVNSWYRKHTTGELEAQASIGIVSDPGSILRIRSSSAPLDSMNLHILRIRCAPLLVAWNER